VKVNESEESINLMEEAFRSFTALTFSP